MYVQTYQVERGRRERVLSYLVGWAIYPETLVPPDNILPVVGLNGTLVPKDDLEISAPTLDAHVVGHLVPFAHVMHVPGEAYEMLASRVVRAADLLKPPELEALQFRSPLPEARVLHEVGADPADIAPKSAYDPELLPFLQDLADQVFADMRAVLVALDDPAAYVPGVEPGSIEPVPDAHVRLVIAAMQRELDREMRSVRGRSSPDVPPVEREIVSHTGHVTYTHLRPPVPLAALPWHAQRALVERRRLRMLQWGITHEVWRTGIWSVSGVHPDPNWTPPSLTVGGAA